MTTKTINIKMASAVTAGATYTVVLTRPSSAITLNGGASVTLNFNSSNWNTNQSVEIIGPDDVYTISKLISANFTDKQLAGSFAVELSSGSGYTRNQSYYNIMREPYDVANIIETGMEYNVTGTTGTRDTGESSESITGDSWLPTYVGDTPWDYTLGGGPVTISPPGGGTPVNLVVTSYSKFFFFVASPSVDSTGVDPSVHPYSANPVEVPSANHESLFVILQTPSGSRSIVPWFRRNPNTYWRNYDGSSAIFSYSDSETGIDVTERQTASSGATYKVYPCRSSDYIVNEWTGIPDSDNNIYGDGHVWFMEWRFEDQYGRTYKMLYTLSRSFYDYTLNGPVVKFQFSNSFTVFSASPSWNNTNITGGTGAFATGPELFEIKGAPFSYSFDLISCDNVVDDTDIQYGHDVGDISLTSRKYYTAIPNFGTGVAHAKWKISFPIEFGIIGDPLLTPYIKQVIVSHTYSYYCP